jgi:LL-diaminopimelate aminotransferase
MMIAHRMDSLTTQFFASLNDRISAFQSAGVEIIRLDIGSPDMPPAPHIIEALAAAAAKPDRHGYQPHSGNSALRKAWAEMYRREYDVPLDSDREIMPLLGSKEGIFHIHQAFVNPGDVVLIPDPGYLTYTQATRFAGGEAYYFPLLPERGYSPDLSNIPASILSRAKLLWLNYPNNPTGASVTKEFFEEVIRFAAQHHILVCHDAAFLGNAEVIKNCYRLKTNVDSGHFLPILEAAAVAMTQDQSWILDRNMTYQLRRDVLVDGLFELGLKPNKPNASLYVWCPIPKGWTSTEFCETMLEKAHVSVTPGIVFGNQGEGCIRIAITSPEEQIEQALSNMKNAWSTIIRSKP